MCVLKAQRIVQYAFQIATAVHDADNSHFTGRFMDKIENSVVIYDQLTHTHGKPGLPVDTGMAGGELFQLANCIADSDGLLRGDLRFQKLCGDVGIDAVALQYILDSVEKKDET